MIDRRMLLRAPAALFAAAMVSRPNITRAAQLNDDGLHVQPWFMDTFLELTDDLAEASAQGKNFAVFFEQRGCPYCREMHTVNLARPEISDYIAANYAPIQLNLWGSRMVTDFDGEELEERDLARKWGVNFTPTICFFPMGEHEAKSGRDLEVARMPGYFKPFHFISMFEYVRNERYKDIDFQRFLQEKVAKLEEEGIKVDIWN